MATARGEVPHGWVDLELLFVQPGEDGVVLDCVVSQVRDVMTSDPSDGLAVGLPVSLEILSPADADGRDELEEWLADEPQVSVLTQDEVCLLLLSLDERTVALELHTD